MFYIADMTPLANLNPAMFGRAFRAERRALGKTQQEIAEAARCRRQTIADLRRGEMCPCIRFLRPWRPWARAC